MLTYELNAGQARTFHAAENAQKALSAREKDVREVLESLEPSLPYAVGSTIEVKLKGQRYFREAVVTDYVYVTDETGFQLQIIGVSVEIDGAVTVTAFEDAEFQVPTNSGEEE